MRGTRVWARLLGVQRAIIEDVSVEEDEEGEMAALVVAVRLRRGDQGRCGKCRRRCPREDRGEGRRRWRHFDLGTLRSFIEATAPRVRCGDHGVVVAWVPWARHAARHTRAFGDTVAWLAVPDGEDGGHRAAADQLAGGGADRHPGQRRSPGQGGSFRRAAARAASSSLGAEGLAALLPERSSTARIQWRSAQVTSWDL